MKKVKIIIPIFLVLMFMPFVVNAETCDTDKISIDSITLEENFDNVEELEEARVNGKNINLNLSMSEVGDNVKYKITVKNDSNEDFDFGKTISQEVYVKHDIEKNIVKKTYVCFSKDGAEYCVQGGENFNYEQEKQTLIAEFGESNCSVYDEHIYCRFPNSISMNLFSNGEIFTKKNTCGPSCRITSDGVSSCEEGMMLC